MSGGLYGIVVVGVVCVVVVILFLLCHQGRHSLLCGTSFPAAMLSRDLFITSITLAVHFSLRITWFRVASNLEMMTTTTATTTATPRDTVSVEPAKNRVLL